MNRVLVTGGGGFLGSRIVQMLLDKNISVRTLQRSDNVLLKKRGVDVIRGDIRDINTIINAAKGCDVIFHVAAKAGVWGDYDDYYQINVNGTKNVLSACKQHNIHKLIYTSSPSVVFAGKDEIGINEATAYPDQFLTAYQKTKALAEQMVLAANNETLATVVLRPHLIWGPNDPHLVPRIIERGKTGRLRLVGRQQNLVDSTYIDNAALAHVLAAEALTASGSCAGKAYFISNDEPLPMATLINKILAAAEISPVTKTIPVQLAYTLGMLLEAVYTIFSIKHEPIITRFVARQLACAHWYNLDAAKKDFAYHASVSIDEGMDKLKASLKLSNNN